jgi:glutathione S-transferase
VRLTLAEKGVPYELVEIDIFAAGGPAADYAQRHPFGRIPAFEHDGFRLYETGAITRYIDEAFPGPPLQPADPKPRARINQILSILDNYLYRPLVWDIFVERVRAPQNGRAADETLVAAALPRVEICLAALEALMGDSPFFAGSQPTLADLHAAPMFAYGVLAPEAAALLARHATIGHWWERMSARPSIAATRSPLEG